MADTTDKDLIARALTGDADAWDAIFDAHYAPTVRFLWQLTPLGSRDEVEDIAQDAFLKVVQRLGQFRGGSRLQTWIFRVAANTARDHREKHLTAKRGGGIEPISLNAPPRDGETAQLDLPTHAPGPDAVIEMSERNAQLRAALDTLDEPCREVIELRYFGDRSYQDIAAELELNEKTVSSRLSKCLDKLEAEVKSKREREFSRAFPSNPS